MRKQIKYTNMPDPVKMSDFEIVDPRAIGLPEALVKKDTLKRVTLLVDEESIASFKRVALKQKGHYQRIMRRVLQEYARTSISGV